MRTLESFSDKTWDQFFDFLADGIADLTQSEVEDELREAGIDMAPAVDRMRKLIERHKPK